MLRYRLQGDEPHSPGTQSTRSETDHSNDDDLLSTCSSSSSIDVDWQEGGDDEQNKKGTERIALLPVEKLRPSVSARRWTVTGVLPFILLLSVAVMIDLSARGASTDMVSPHHAAQQSPCSLEQSNVVHSHGWKIVVEDLRVELAAVATEMWRNETKALKKSKKHKTKTPQTLEIDISPYADVIERALDTVGVRGVWSGLFDGLKWYLPKSKPCSKHGEDCHAHDIWWLNHYAGAVTAEKLLRDGSLLVDGVTGERLDDAKSFMKEIHRIQRQRYSGLMSFHAIHAFIWYYVAATMPDLDTYPTQLAQDFCGDYLRKDKKIKSAHKKLGIECYHGFGHAVFFLLALRQQNGNGSSSSTINARTQFRPKGGFVLNDEAVCEGFNICYGASNVTKNPILRCRGGLKHSAWLFSKMLKTHDDMENYFDYRERQCNEAASD